MSQFTKEFEAAWDAFTARTSDVAHRIAMDWQAGESIHDRLRAVYGVPLAPLGPLVHPSDVEWNVAADAFVFDTTFAPHGPRGWGRIRSALVRGARRLLAAAVGGGPRA